MKRHSHRIARIIKLFSSIQMSKMISTRIVEIKETHFEGRRANSQIQKYLTVTKETFQNAIGFVGIIRSFNHEN